MQMSRPPAPNFEQAIALLTHAEAEIRRAEMQATVLMATNALIAALAVILDPRAGIALILMLTALSGLALGTVVLLADGGGGRTMKDARQALYLDAIGERDSFADFMRSFTLLSASPGERVLHAVWLRSIWARRKLRIVRALGALTGAGLLLAGVLALQSLG
ncbi:MAG: hypothetical protein AAFN05_16725 [Pseudomonadota bacterium]